jgi:hypothetical protein
MGDKDRKSNRLCVSIVLLQLNQYWQNQRSDTRPSRRARGHRPACAPPLPQAPTKYRRGIWTLSESRNEPFFFYNQLVI